jgi:hypothetical protein
MIVARGMMMLMLKLKLTDVNTKVHCSNVPPMFHLLEQTQVVDSKGFFTLFYMFVPMFQYIYKGRRVAKSLYNVQWFDGFRSDEPWLRRLKHGTLEQE